MLRRSLIFLVLLSAGCVSLDPHYSTPESPIPATLPGAQGQGKAISHDWQQVIHDPRLQQVVTIALNSNRDVQKAIADIDSARALYGQTNASLFPTVNAALSSTRSRSLANGTGTTAEADGTVSSYTLDLFGRNQSLSRAARETWLASEFTAQNTRLTLIAEISTAWLTLAADNSNLALAKETMASAENSLKIIQRQQQVGTAAATDVSEAMSVYQQARASVASYQTQVMQDKNALNLLAGTTLAENLLPGTLESLPEQMISLVPAGVSSDVLLRRPDIQEAEHNLKSANADIGAARANFFPTISLTASAGVGSDALSSLFSHGIAQVLERLGGVWTSSSGVNLKVYPSSDGKSFDLYIYSDGVVTDIAKGTVDRSMGADGSFDFRYKTKAGDEIWGLYKGTEDTVEVTKSGWTATWKRLK